MEFSVLDVDLEKRKIRSRDLSGLLPDYIGGKGLGTKLLYDELPPGTDPLSPENILIFMAGPLSGTPAPMSGRMSAVSRSPLTGAICDSHCGGYFAYQMRKAGIGGMIFRGRSPEPVYLRIQDGDAVLEDASDLWGLDTRETEDVLKDDRATRVISIGKAGENLVRFASIIHDGHRAFGRGGLGAVMGSKNLKAVVARGAGRVPVHDPEGLKKVSRRCYALLAEHPTTGRVLRRYGTPNVLNIVNAQGRLPTRYFSAGSFEGAEAVSGEEMEGHIVGHYGCFGCPVRCGKTVEVRGVRSRSLEYETIFAFGPLCGNDDLETVARANELCNAHGMDTISCGSAVAYFIALAGKGLVDWDITWGDREKILELVELTAGREGPGDLLAEGVKGMAEKTGDRDAVHVKGMELPGYDPRGTYGLGLAYATSNRGACHLRGPVYIEELLTSDLKPGETAGKAARVKHLQDLHAAIDSMGICKFTARALTADDYADLLGAATGIAFTGDDILAAGEAIFNLERAFNLREGFGREDDVLPVRLREEVNEELLREYYALRGWD
ncbi:MAG: aldehyde ferredoxin oxidoreductase family protein [Euryarchaeota archaeon]|nr:aldehyde ferredoxin oxidoreductase family protein [Euryarchaeota archaeon]